MTEKTVNTNTAPAQAGAYLVHQARRRARYALVFFVLIAAFSLITVLNINIGNIPIPLERIVEILFTKTGNPTEVNIIWKIRLPRILMAAILGGALSLAGFRCRRSLKTRSPDRSFSAFRAARKWSSRSR